MSRRLLPLKAAIKAACLPVRVRYLTIWRIVDRGGIKHMRICGRIYCTPGAVRRGVLLGAKKP